MRKQTKLVAALSAAALLAIGASMTSFAATAGWVQEGEDWVYLNKEGDRDANVWRRSGDNYYWLDENGVMARNALIKDDTVDAIYCVDENGVRVVNDWREIPNDDGAQVGSENTDDTPTVVYYYFGSSGKAYKGESLEKKVREIGGKYYIFNDEGQMLYGWHKDSKDNLYYLGTEREGFAYTGWQHLEPRDYLNGEDYDELEWFYFGSTGKASVGKTQYIDGKYYHFNEDGVLDDDWYTNTATPPTVASGAKAFSTLYGAKMGWVYTGDANLPEEQRYDNDGMYWYYLVNVRENANVIRSIPYNYQAKTDELAYSAIDGATHYDVNAVARALVIKNKTYLFDADGKMKTGFIVINSAGNVGGDIVDARLTAPDRKIVKKFDSGLYLNSNVTGNKALRNGLYYFSELGGSLTGQMQMGRTAITKDGETYYYFFSKNNNDPGWAFTNSIVDGYLYGEDGRCVMAESGNSYAIYKLPAGVTIMRADGNQVTTTPSSVAADKFVVISRTGKVKPSGTVTIDGTKYNISGYVATPAQN